MSDSWTALHGESTAQSGVRRGDRECNNGDDQSELGIMIGSLTHRLFLYVAMIMVALLPLEATYAASDCAPVAAMAEDEGECGDCKDEVRQHCQSYCLALCQSIPANQAPSPDARAVSSLTFLALRPRFPPFLSAGPEPPPPRMLR